MRAAVIRKPGELVVRNVPRPSPLDDYQALVRIDACCICNSTDRKLIEGKFPGITRNSYPAILGHESVGEVIELGPKVRRFREGDIVLRPRAQYRPGARGGMNVCWGGFAEYGLVTDYDAFARDYPEQRHPDWSWPAQQVVPPGMDPAEATILVTLKETLSWLRKFEVGPETSLLIFGAGPVGLALCEISKLLGSPTVAVVGRRDNALAAAQSFGADAVINSYTEDVASRVRDITKGRGFDRAIDAIGLAALIDLAPAVLAPGGRFGLYGVEDAPRGRVGGRISIPAGGEWSLSQIAAAEHLAHDEVLELVGSGRLRPSRYITHRLSIEQITEAFALIGSKRALKVVIDMHPEF